MADYDALTSAAESKYKIPTGYLSRLVSVESANDPTAVSDAGAKGLTQLMDATARDLGVTDPFDPKQSIDGGARYLRQMYDQFGSWPMALAAYNAGPGKVARMGGVPTSWHGVRRYVDKVMGMPDDASGSLYGGPPTTTDVLPKDLEKQLVSSASEAAKARSDYAAGIKADDKAERDLLSQPLPARPPLPAHVETPNAPTPHLGDPMQVFGQVAPWLAILGGAMTRNGALGALTAANGLMKGYKDRDQAVIDNQRKNFEEQLKAATSRAMQEAQEYTMALSDAKMGMEERRLKFEEVATLSGNRQAILAAQTGNFNDMYKLATTLQAAGYRSFEAWKSLQQLQIQQQNLENAKRRTDAYATSVHQRAPAIVLQQSEKLRKDLTSSGVGKAWETAAQQIGPVTSLMKKVENAKGTGKNALGSQQQAALLDAFTRVMTGGVPRQFTIRMAQDHGSIWDNLQALKQRVDRGGVLSPRQEEEMVAMISEFVDDLKKTYGQAIQRSIDQGASMGIPGTYIVPPSVDPKDFNLSMTPPAGPPDMPADDAGPAEPPIGTIEGNHRYMGGGAADPKNWEQINGGPTD